MTAPRATSCAACDAPLPDPAPRGRPRLYCRDACRARAYRRRLLQDARRARRLIAQP